MFCDILFLGTIRFLTSSRHLSLIHRFPSSFGALSICTEAHSVMSCFIWFLWFSIYSIGFFSLFFPISLYIIILFCFSKKFLFKNILYSISWSPNLSTMNCEMFDFDDRIHFDDSLTLK